jgi:hypothetical protein
MAALPRGSSTGRPTATAGQFTGPEAALHGFLPAVTRTGTPPNPHTPLFQVEQNDPVAPVRNPPIRKAKIYVVIGKTKAALEKMNRTTVLVSFETTCTLLSGQIVAVAGRRSR